MLKLSLKLDMFREDLFKEYIERPTEVNYHLKDGEVRRKNQKGSYKLQKWNQACLQNVQVKSFNNSSEDLIGQYLKLICTKNQGDLTAYESRFEQSYL